jgi:hypothetical protein
MSLMLDVGSVHLTIVVPVIVSVLVLHRLLRG